MEENYIKLIAEINQRSMSNSHRLDDLESSNKLMMELCSNIKLLAQRQELLTEEIKDLKKDIIGIKEKPAKRWDLIVSTIITVVVTALVTTFVAGAF